MGKALYRKYRSKSLDEIVGQQHITDILRRAIDTDRVAHAYLLTGPRGVGKTSIARILAHEINGLPYTDESTHLDIIEIDAASNNSVDDVRDLRERVQIAPVSAARKIYIIDEVHMLSKQAFNALLKTLEEPPAHVVFILATTDVDKLPATIISRVQRYTFRAISEADAVNHLRMIADKEKINIDDDALILIARHGQGSFRDSISLLDQLASVRDAKSTITRGDVERALGLATDDSVEQLVNAYVDGSIADVVTLLDELEHTGAPAATVATQLITHIRPRIADNPHLLSLLDDLLEVGKSSYPYIKLLSVLSANTSSAHPQTKSSETASQAPTSNQDTNVRVAAVDEATRVSFDSETSAAPSDADAYSTDVGREAVEDANERSGGEEANVTGPTKNDGERKRNKPRTEPDADDTTKPAADALPTTQFDWNTLLTSIKSVALKSILAKSSYAIDHDTLTIYAGNAFAKKKLDHATYRPQLLSAVASAGGGELEVVTVGKAAPPKDSKTAAILDMMGGGEEVNVSE